VTTYPTKLSPRELDIMACLEEGLSTEATSERLHITRNTVRNHIASIMTKLGATSRMEIIAIARGDAGPIPKVEPVSPDQRAITVLRFIIDRGIPITDSEAAAITKAFT
jgi:DNA-binding CsgD family transcriptional regulator